MVNAPLPPLPTQRRWWRLRINNGEKSSGGGGVANQKFGFVGAGEEVIGSNAFRVSFLIERL